MNPAAPTTTADGTSWLAFVPRDTVFVRDGRSFDAATDTTAQTVRPSPTTIAGAIDGQQAVAKPRPTSRA